MLVSDVPRLRQYWYPVAYVEQVGADPVRRRLLGQDLVVWSPAPGAFSAAADRCAHRGARLSQGWVDGGCLVCPYHGWSYASDGRCVVVPSAPPGTPIPRRAELASVGATHRYGLVWVTLEPAIAEPLPELPEAEDDGYVVAHELMEQWDVAAPQVMENALDVSHVSFVHRQSVGSSASPRFGEFSVRREGLSIFFVVEHTAQVTVQQRADRPDGSTTTRRVTHGELVQPFVFRGVLAYPDTGLEHILFKTVTPVDDEHSLFCQFIARNDRPSESQLAAIVDLDRRVQSEDKVILEGLASDFPLALADQVHTKADKMTVEYRRVLAELAGACAMGDE